MIDHWMFKCKDISYLISKSMDDKLALRIRLGIKFHLMMCNLCQKYKNQLELIQKAILQLDDNKNELILTERLPDKARLKLKKILNTEKI